MANELTVNLTAHFNGKGQQKPFKLPNLVQTMDMSGDDWRGGTQLLALLDGEVAIDIGDDITALGTLILMNVTDDVAVRIDVGGAGNMFIELDDGEFCMFKPKSAPHATPVFGDARIVFWMFEE
jgi:hypothetical protein